MSKILVIEDEPTVRANIFELLETADYDVVTAENGWLGALWAQENIPDLIICDVMMPEIDGYTNSGLRCAKLRQNTYGCI